MILEWYNVVNIFSVGIVLGYCVFSYGFLVGFIVGLWAGRKQ